MKATDRNPSIYHHAASKHFAQNNNFENGVNHQNIITSLIRRLVRFSIAEDPTPYSICRNWPLITSIAIMVFQFNFRVSYIENHELLIRRILDNESHRIKSLNAHFQ